MTWPGWMNSTAAPTLTATVCQSLPTIAPEFLVRLSTTAARRPTPTATTTAYSPPDRLQRRQYAAVNPGASRRSTTALTMTVTSRPTRAWMSTGTDSPRCSAKRVTDNDDNDTINPGAAELLDELDNDCESTSNCEGQEDAGLSGRWRRECAEQRRRRDDTTGVYPDATDGRRTPIDQDNCPDGAG